MLSRILSYLQSMYPPVPRLLFSFTYFFGIYFGVQVLSSTDPLVVTSGALAGAVTFFLFLLFLRVSDELKDIEIDLKLFPERVVPSGGVTIPDLRVLLAVIVILLFAVNMTYGNALKPFLLLYGFGYLMLKFFYYPEVIRPNLLLALVTHNPSAILLNLFAVSVFAADFEKSIFTVDNLIIVVIFWLPWLIWELCRKIRAPQDENDYITYSRIFGYRLAAFIPAFLMTLHMIMVMSMSGRFSYSIWFLCAYAALYLICLLPYLRFVLKPDARTAALKIYGEIYMFGGFLFLLVEFIFTRSVTWLGN